MIVKYRENDKIVTIKCANNIVYLEGANKLYIDYDNYTRSVKITPSCLISILKK